MTVKHWQLYRLGTAEVDGLGEALVPRVIMDRHISWSWAQIDQLLSQNNTLHVAYPRGLIEEGVKKKGVDKKKKQIDVLKHECAIK